jgi:hypothetical protein
MGIIWKNMSLENMLHVYPGAMLTARRQYPEGNPHVLLRAGQKVCKWHEDNNTLEECTKTYRGDFYKPISGSPEASLYWGDFWEKEPIAKVPKVVSREELRKAQREQIAKAAKTQIAGKRLSTGTAISLGVFERKLKRFGLDKNIEWRVCESYELKSTNDHDRILIEDNGQQHELNFSEHYQRDYYGASEFWKRLDALEGQTVLLCFANTQLQGEPVLIDVRLPDDIGEFDSKINALKLEDRKLRESYKTALHETTLKAVDLHDEEVALQKQFDEASNRLKEKAKANSDEERRLKAERQQKTGQMQKRREAELLKLATFLPVAKKLEAEAIEEKITPLEPSTRAVRRTKPSVLDTLDNLLSTIPDKRAEEPSSEENLPNPEVAILQARLNEAEAKAARFEAERDAAEEKAASDERQLILYNHLEQVKAYHNQSEQEKADLRQLIIENEIKELTKDEREAFFANCEKLKDRLKDEFGKPIKVRLYHGHPKDMLALRGGVNHQVNQLPLVLAEWLDGNQYRVSLPDYTVDIIAALDFDKDHPGEIMVKTFMNLAGEMWLNKEFTVTGYNMKFKKGIKLKQYISWHKAIAAHLHIEQSEKKGQRINL